MVDDQQIKSQDIRNLALRLGAAAVLAPLALLLAYVGGHAWTILAALVAIGLFSEWVAIVGVTHLLSLVLGMAGLLAAAIFAGSGHFDLAIACAAAGAIGATMFAPGKRGWGAGGVVYAAAALIASVVLRRDASEGFAAILFVLLLVWATDSGGYFVGRAIGGPKLWPQVSPKKTWAGALGGFVGALLVGAGFVAMQGSRLAPLLAVAAVLSVGSQGGDLFESAIKRRFGVKDSGRLIPGHGGLLDRLDGFVAAIVLAALIGVARGGSDGAGRGLMVW